VAPPIDVWGGCIPRYGLGLGRKGIKGIDIDIDKDIDIDIER
jgi:hypothetical protein